MFNEQFVENNRALLTVDSDAFSVERFTMEALFIETFMKEEFINRRNGLFIVEKEAVMEDILQWMLCL